MANLVDDTGSVNSNLVSGKGTNSATFPMPGNVALQVESVVATVDNSAGAATGATLVVKDQSGVVIATKRQVRTIPAGDTGTMTWALRNSADDELTGIFFDIENQGATLLVETTGSTEFDGNPVTLFSGGAFGIVQLFSENRITVDADGVLNLTGGDRINLNATNLIQGGTAEWSFSVGAGGWTLATSGPVDIDASAGSNPITLKIATGQKVEVKDHTGAAIFRVNENGDLQGKTGKALTFNL